jgi:hypothetical protein
MRISEASIELRKSSSRDVLADAIRRRHAILFVGAGVSMAVGLPSWQSLVDHLLKELDLSPDVIDGMSDGYQMLAEFYRLKQGGMGPLRSWLDRNWKVAADRVAESQLHKLIVELDFPTIYTTNYDRNLETAFDVHKKPYAKIANAKQMADAVDGVTHIVKYHGDFDDDASLVLTETDFLIDYPSTPHWISSFAQTPWVAPSCSLDTACPTPTSDCCCTAFGRPGKDQVTGIIARARLCSCLHRIPCKRRCSHAGELRC